MESKITELLQSLCNGVGLVYKLIFPKFQEILKKELISNDSPTYRNRVRVAVDFLEKRNSEARKIGSSEAEQDTFREEFEKYLADKLASCTDEELLQDRETSRNVSFLEEGFPIAFEDFEGIVLRCSLRYAAINLFPSSSSNAFLEVAKEVVVQVPNDIPGFGIKLKIGDVLSLRFSSATNRDEHVSMKRCNHLTKKETESVIKKAIEIFDSDGASEALDAVISYSAVWSYVVEESCKSNQEVALKVLSFCCNIVDDCSEHRFKTSLEKFFKPFVHVDSCFLTETLKQLVINFEKDSEQKRLLVKFIHQVVKLYPDRCLTLIPILQLPCFTEAECNKEFWIRLLTSVTPNIPRAFEVGKPDDLPWKVIPLIPLSKEVESYRLLKTDHLPKIREDERYDSVDQYLHTYFTLLREECFFKLKKGIQGVANGKLDPKDITLYWVSFENIKFVSTPYVGGLSLSLKVDNLTENSESQSKANIDWESKEFLKVGNLVCLSLDKTFRQPVWAYVSLNDEKERGYVSITMFNDRNMKSDLDMADIITKLHELKGKGVKAFMAESQTFYTAFGHTMKVLQERDKVPFEDCLVEAKTPGPAHYIEEAQFSPDWSCIFSSSKEYPDQEGNPQYDLLKDFDDRKKPEDTTLDETQLAALELALKHKVALIQGPPGTGKTYVGLKLLKILHSLNFKQGNNLGPILIVTYKNLALNQFLTKCLEMLPKNTLICRVGKNWDDIEGTLKKCRIFEINKKLKVKRRSTKEIERQIEELKMQLLESCNKLKMGSKFTANVFMEEAEKQTIFWMLVGNGDDIQRAEAQNLVYNNAEVEGRKELLEMHITSLLKKWLPKEGKVADALEDNLKIHIKSDNKEAKEDIVGSCVEASAEVKERLGALGDDDSDDQEVAEWPQQHSKNREPEWGQQLLPLPDETIERYNNLLNTVNPWELEDDERIKFAHVLLKRFRDKAKREFLQLQREYIAKLDELILSRSRFDAQVLKKCHIIGMTVTGATMRSDILASVKPRIMIVEEAAEVLEADLLAAIPLSVEHLIMIGDQKQLKPQVHHPKLRKECHMDLSMFERLANCGLPLQQLGFQCRMRSKFAELLNKLGLYKDPIRTNKKLVASNNPPPCIETSMFFQTHTEKEENSKDSHSKCNTREVVHLSKVATHLCKNEISKDKITVLCSYRGQVNLIKKEFEKKSLEGIQVTTIDSFQGQEQDIVLISLVRSRGKNIGYLSSPNRLCVAISRARCGMYLFGNDLTLSEKSSKWKVVIGELRKQKMIGNKFPFGTPKIEVNKTPNRSVKDKDKVVKRGNPDLELLRLLAKYVTQGSRKTLGRALDLDDPTLDGIEEQQSVPYERSYKMLQRWSEIKGSDATFEALEKGLLHSTVNRKDLAEMFCYEEQALSDKEKQTTCGLPTPILENQAGEERKPIQTASQAALTGATDEAMTPTQVQEKNATPESRNQSVSACVSANIGIARGKSKDGSTDKDVTVVPAEEVGSKSIAADEKGFQDKEDPVQESQQPHVKGDPHEEVGELTDDAKKPRTESGQS